MSAAAAKKLKQKARKLSKQKEKELTKQRERDAVAKKVEEKRLKATQKAQKTAAKKARAELVKQTKKKHKAEIKLLSTLDPEVGLPGAISLSFAGIELLYCLHVRVPPHAPYARARVKDSDLSLTLMMLLKRYFSLSAFRSLRKSGPPKKSVPLSESPVRWGRLNLRWLLQSRSGSHQSVDHTASKGTPF